MPTDSIYSNGMARVCAVSVPVHLADPGENAQQILAAARQCSNQGAALAVYPEMSLTGYSVMDLVQNQALLEAVVNGVNRVVAGSRGLAPILVVGAPLRLGDSLYNCAVAVRDGKILGVTPKTHLAEYRGFQEKRYFSTLPPSPTPRFAKWDPRFGLKAAAPCDAVAFPFGPFLVQAEDLPGFSLALEISEDVWAPVAVSSLAALSGATVIGNLSASPQTVGASKVRRKVLSAQSLTTLSAYVYSAAGFGESSTDAAWSGEAFVYEVGELLASSQSYEGEVKLTCADVDLDMLRQLRLQQTGFGSGAERTGAAAMPVVSFKFGDVAASPGALARQVARFPFITSDASVKTLEDAVQVRDLGEVESALEIQASALVRRMVSIGEPKLILGVSGGLDSTLALLVSARAMDTLGRPRTDIITYTMPGFGTTPRTQQNAQRLAKAVGATFNTLDIRPAAREMLEAMDHPFGRGEPAYDLTFENVQAGLRTDYLFRLAGSLGGIVVGTGDLSELALGWCTFGVGDHMSHYGVNGGLPKTMIQYLLMHVADTNQGAPLAEVVGDILGTEISPELIPASEDAPVQATQGSVGPYELQDFTLFHFLKYGYSPRKIFCLARAAWEEKYSAEEILKWLRVFHYRFFVSQYKRSTLPDGPQVMQAGSLSPRGDWRMPTDALSNVWLEEISKLEEELAASSIADVRPGPRAHAPTPSAAPAPNRKDPEVDVDR